MAPRGKATPGHHGASEGRSVAHGLPGAALDKVSGVDAAVDLAPVVGANLRRLRMKRGLSLERLARASGVSRAMLCQIELGQSAPTINVLWKIASALDVTFSALIHGSAARGTEVLRRSASRCFTRDEGGLVARALFPFDRPRRIQLFELTVRPLAVERADPHPPGTTENLVVSAGALELEVGGEVHHLDAGDAILFEADVPHGYRNPGSVPATSYLVMTYADVEG